MKLHHLFHKRKHQSDTEFPVVDSHLFKVILFASFVIVLSIVLISTAVYRITEKEAVHKLTTKDLPFIAEAISSKIDTRIERAKETSMILANDPAMIEWLQGQEEDERLQQFVFNKIGHLAFDYDYSNSFVVSTSSGHYWDENGNLIDTMTESDPDDSWYYDIISSRVPVHVVVDYHEERKNTFVFVDVLMGDVDNPIGVTGIGLSLTSISEDFQNFKYGDESNLWLIDHEGTIYLSDDIAHNGKNIGTFVSEETKNKLLTEFKSGTQIVDYKNQSDEKVDLLSYPLQSTDLKLLVEIPRFETVSFLQKIKWNTVIAASLFIIAIIFLFYFFSAKFANPYKRALEQNEQLEQKVIERTKELTDKNIKIMDSIDYAKRIQESILPSEEQLKLLIKDYFLIWKPRDIVGGDFIWTNRVGEGRYFIAVGDCTGHGVPGAMMSMLAISILNQLVNRKSIENPGYLLQQLNQNIKDTLNQNSQEGTTDDGLDIGIVYIEEGKKAVFSGAKCSLYVTDHNDIATYKGERYSIGYRRTSKDFEYTNQLILLNEHQSFYMSTDGYVDQNGGSKNYSFGKTRFLELIREIHTLPLKQQQKHFEQKLAMYMGSEEQRDDITVVAFRPKGNNSDHQKE